MVKSRAEPVYQISSESAEPKEGNGGGSSTEGSESDSLTLVISDEEPEVESAYEDEEEEEGGRSRSDDLNLKLISLISRPLKSSSQKLETVLNMPSKGASLKRASVDLKEGAAKKPKQKHLFQRLWSEEDEIAILKGMIDYVAEKNTDPLADLNAFHQFIEKAIHIDVSHTQLLRKIRRLKKKFQNNTKKAKDGKDRTFSNPHEQEAYALSKMIWNSEGNLVGGSIAEHGPLLRKKKVVEELNTADGNVRKFIPYLEENSVNFLAVGGGTVEERIVRIGDELFSGKNAGVLGKQWRNLKAREVELYIAQLEVKKARAKLVLDLLKS